MGENRAGPLVLTRTSPALGRGMRNSSMVSGRPGSQNTAPRMKLGPPDTWYPAAAAESGAAEKDRRRAPPIRPRARREAVAMDMVVCVLANSATARLCKVEMIHC